MVHRNVWTKEEKFQRQDNLNNNHWSVAVLTVSALLGQFTANMFQGGILTYLLENMYQVFVFSGLNEDQESFKLEDDHECGYVAG